MVPENYRKLLVFRPEDGDWMASVWTRTVSERGRINCNPETVVQTRTMDGTPPQPVPRPRQRQHTGNVSRKRLVESFAGFSASTVSDEQIQAARDCIHGGGPPSARYAQVPFDRIMNQNQHKADHLTMMTSAYDLLLKYVINLMKPRRPQVWRSIKTNNTAFKARVSCMEGAKDILKSVGYSVVTETAMQFPDSTNEPNRTLLEAIAAELLMAKLEVDEKNTQQLSPPRPQPVQSSSDHHQHQGSPDTSLQQGLFLSPRETIAFQSQPGMQYTDVQQSVGNGLCASSSTPSSTPSLPTHSTPSFPTHSTPTPSTLPMHTHTSSTPSSIVSQSPQTPTPKPRPRVPRTPSSSSAGKPTPPVQQTQAFLYQQQSSSGSDVFGEGGDETTPTRPKTARSTSTQSDRSDLSHSDSFDSVTSNESGRTDSVCSTSSSHLEFLRQMKEKRSIMRQDPTHYSESHIRSHDSSTPVVQERVSSTCMIRELESGHGRTKQPIQGWSSNGLQNGSAASVTIKRPPGKREHPDFRTDTIVEEEEPEYCEKCFCRLNPGDVCLYCSDPINRKNNNSSGEIQYSDPPEPAVPHQQEPSTNQAPAIPPRLPRDKPPLPFPSEQRHNSAVPGSVVRASPQAADEAVKQHRLSQLHRVVDPTGATQAMQPPLQIRTGDLMASAGATQATQPQLQVGNEPFQPAEATGRESMAPNRPYGDHEQPSAATPGYYGGEAGVPSSSQAEASGGGETYEAYLMRKEKAWKESQLKQGIKREDLEPLPERLEYDRQQKQRKQQKLPKVDASRFERVDQTPLSKYEEEVAETQRMERLEKDGLDFLLCVKGCLHYGFSMAEVQIAFQNPAGKDPLQYLQNEWTRTIRNIQFYVSAHNQEIRRSVGEPTDEEARKCLIEAGGDMTKAMDSCYEQRKKKTEELLKKMSHRSEFNLTWEGAVRALTLNEMDVNAACWVIQCETLQPLYESIFTESIQVKQKDMEETKKLIKNKEFDQEACHRLLMAEYRLDSHKRAHMVFELMEEVEADGQDYPLGYYVEAAKDYDDIEKARQYLIKPCPICVEAYPIHEMVTMPGCTDSICRDCFGGHFKVAIKEQSVKHFNCPLCSEPDLANRDTMQAVYLELFVGMVREHTDPDTYQLCQQKLTEFNLSKETGFRWCANEKCKSGFINEQRDDIKKLQCPTCSQFMCFQCKKPWEDQHNDISCEDFAQWKKDNDPEAQQQGLAAHLTANGIDCPNCNMHYELARGGCMHFRCTQCPNEFCSGCGGSFKNGKNCGRLESCAARGLHAHHPRDCLFYLRDFSVEELQAFLRKHDVEFDTEPPKGQLDAARQKKEAAEDGEDGGDDKEGGKEKEADEEEERGEEKVEFKCCVVLQKELAQGLTDEECGKDVNEGHAGLCETHYKEYLVDKINKAKLDPITIYETVKIALILTREEMDVPGKEEEDGVEEDEADYRERLIKHVQQALPLDRK